MPWEVGTNIEDRLETTLRDVLKMRTDSMITQRALERFLLYGDGAGRFRWILEGESEPPAPFGRLSKKSVSRFGNGVPIYRWHSGPNGKQRYLEEWWRISIELVRSEDGAEERINNTPPLSAIFSQIMREQFKFPAGRAQLEVAGIFGIRLTDEGDSDEGNAFSFDCYTESFVEEPSTGESPTAQ